MANQQTKDLMSALDEFKKGVEEYNQFTAIDNANQLVQKIRSSAESDAAKRAQLQNIANDLVGQMALNGTPATTMQTVAGAIAQPLPGSTEAAAVQAATTGNEELLQNIVKGERAINAPREAAIARRMQSVQELKNEAKPKAGAKPISDAQINKIQDLDEEMMTGRSILEKVKSNPNLVGVGMRFPGASTARELVDPEFASFNAQMGQWFDQYRIRVTGAGASGSELAVLQRNRPKAGDTQAAFKKKIEAILSVGEKVKQRRLSNLKKAGRDVSGFEEAQMEEQEATQGSAEPKIETRRQRSTGKLVKVLVDASGKVLRVLE